MFFRKIKKETFTQYIIENVEEYKSFVDRCLHYNLDVKAIQSYITDDKRTIPIRIQCEQLDQDFILHWIIKKEYYENGELIKTYRAPLACPNLPESSPAPDPSGKRKIHGSSRKRTSKLR